MLWINCGDTFYRYENNYNYLYGLGREIATGESLLYGYNSIEHYSSAYDFNVDRFLANMGYSDIPGEKYFLCETYWNSPMLLADSLLSIKYVQLKDAATGYEDTGIKMQRFTKMNMHCRLDILLVRIWEICHSEVIRLRIRKI